MNPEKLKKLQAQAALVRIGGKGELQCFQYESKEIWKILVFVALLPRNFNFGRFSSIFRHAET